MRPPAAAAPTCGGGTAGRRDERGQATVELALVLPFVALLALLVVQAALVARDAVLVHHAAREAARSTAVDPDPGVAREAAVSSSGLDPDRLQLDVRGRGDTGSRATVQVGYSIPTDVPVIGTLVPDLQITTTLQVRVE